MASISLDPDTSPLISTAQLQQKLKHGTSGQLVVLDTGANLGDTGDCYTDLYTKGHIPTARYFNMDEGVMTSPTIARSLPNAYSLVKQLRRLGVNNNSNIVVYDHSAKPYNSARLRWLLKVHGLSNASILDGGIRKWKNDGYDVTTEEEIDIPTGTFVATVTDELARDRKDVKAVVGQGTTQILDSRERVNFTGAADHSATLSGGHIPGALNIPYSELFQGDGTFKPAEEIRKLFVDAKYDETKPTIAMCRTGMTVCSLVAAAELVSLPEMPIYNGSWMEWCHTEKDLRAVDTGKID